jgi:hypothetical protein
MVWRLGLRGLEWGWRWDGSEATGGATGEEEESSVEEEESVREEA